MGKSRGYIDRKESIAGKKRSPNVLQSAQAVPCSSSRHSAEGRFAYKIISPRDSSVLEVVVHPNNVCIALWPSMSPSTTKSVRVLLSADDSISGRNKRGAQVVASGSPALEIVRSDGSTLIYKLPIGGQLLEVNEKALHGAVEAHEYVCVLMPNTAIPSLDGPRDYQALCNSIETKKKDRTCHAWRAGRCDRTDCKFLHEEPTEVDESLEESSKRLKTVHE